jgi:hypothetical protein
MSDTPEYFLREYMKAPNIRHANPEHVAWALAKIERLRAALKPFAKMYAKPGGDLDKAIQEARRALGQEDKG